jgi:hypothetical protein
VSERFSISLLSVGALLVALSYALTFAAEASIAPWFLAVGATLVLTGLGLLGAGERAPRLAAVVLVACALTFIGFAIALVIKPHAVNGPLLLGLPRATTLMLLLTGLVPLVLLPVAYALLFKREVLVDE